MQTYVADVIPKIQKFSHKLENLSMLTIPHWVILDELTQSKTVYIFRSNGELLIAINGIINKAKWEYLGPNSILIDLKDQSYLFRHGFFDENILALKIDSKEEYAILVSESKYQGGLNSISAVINFLNHNYLVNSVPTIKQLETHQSIIADIRYERDGYTLKMGSFKEFVVRLTNKEIFKFYQKNSNGKYYMYTKRKIIIFPDKETCIKYIKEQALQH